MAVCLYNTSKLFGVVFVTGVYHLVQGGLYLIILPPPSRVLGLNYAHCA